VWGWPFVVPGPSARHATVLFWVVCVPVRRPECGGRLSLTAPCVMCWSLSPGIRRHLRAAHRPLAPSALSIPAQLRAGPCRIPTVGQATACCAHRRFLPPRHATHPARRRRSGTRKPVAAVLCQTGSQRDGWFSSHHPFGSIDRWCAAYSLPELAMWPGAPHPSLDKTAGGNTSAANSSGNCPITLLLIRSRGSHAVQDSRADGIQARRLAAGAYRVIEMTPFTEQRGRIPAADGWRGDDTGLRRQVRRCSRTGVRWRHSDGRPFLVTGTAFLSPLIRRP
jgi:hypothetical protein